MSTAKGIHITAPKPALAPESFSVWLDTFRWIAACVVLISHAGGELLVNVSSLAPAQQTFPHLIYGFIAGFSHHAVMIFFVLSGLLVGGSFSKDLALDRVDLATYFVKRILRLWIVLLPALVLTFILFRLGQAVLPDSAVIYSPDRISSLGISAFFCNAFFLQTVACQPYGGNGALWSLYNEFWYYVAFPVFALSLVSGFGNKSRLMRAALVFVVLLVLTLLQFRMSPMLPYFLIWLMGVGVALAPKPVLVKSSLLSAVIFVVAVVFIRGFFGKAVTTHVSVAAFLADIVVGLLFSHLLVAMKHSARLVPPPGGGFHRWMAGFSFSLYCIHLPVLMLYAVTMQRIFGVGARMTPSSPVHWLIVFGGLLLSIAVAYLFSLFTEARTDDVRQRVMKLLNLRKGGRVDAGQRESA
ncbi:MAG: acyltransferase [Parvibaculaceae bacterium]|nr:acyltransferase [Parvibaculaceae bacterium]